MCRIHQTEVPYLPTKAKGNSTSDNSVTISWADPKTPEGANAQSTLENKVKEHSGSNNASMTSLVLRNVAYQHL